MKKLPSKAYVRAAVTVAGLPLLTLSGVTQTLAQDQILNVSDGTTAVAFSLVEGGLSNGSLDGGGNVDGNPRLVDVTGVDGIPGSVDDDLGLQKNSPAVNAGSNSLLPADRFDIDGDGDTAEPMPLDILGGDRSIDPNGGAAVVDMGAAEATSGAPVSTTAEPEIPSLRFETPFPNPLSSRSTLSFSVPATDQLEIVVYDVTGRQRLVLFDGIALGERDYRIPIQASDLASGVYFARLRSALYERATQFVVVR